MSRRKYMNPGFKSMKSYGGLDGGDDFVIELTRSELGSVDDEIWDAWEALDNQDIDNDGDVDFDDWYAWFNNYSESDPGEGGGDDTGFE